MAQRILTSTDRLVGLFPRAGRAVDGGSYEVPIVPPYMVRYRIEGGRVLILRVRHGARQTED
jgi:plasmid stabilization system protein ParE